MLFIYFKVSKYLDVFKRFLTINLERKKKFNTTKTPKSLSFGRAKKYQKGKKKPRLVTLAKHSFLQLQLTISKNSKRV